MNGQEEFKQLFLKEFLKRAIMSSLQKQQGKFAPKVELPKLPEKPAISPEEKETILIFASKPEVKEKEKPREITALPMPATPVPAPQISKVPPVAAPLVTSPPILAPTPKPSSIQPAKPSRIKQTAMQMPARPAIPQAAREQGISSLEKLNYLIRDPTIQTIDCPGAGKPITVNRSGLIQATGTILTKDEIQEIMRELSEKTKIPLTPGIFRVAYQNLIITAIISEFVGTRFIIQKGSPQAMSPAFPPRPRF